MHQQSKGCRSSKDSYLSSHEICQSLGKGGESAFIFIQSYFITSRTYTLEIIFADTKYFDEQKCVIVIQEVNPCICNPAQVREYKIPSLFQSV